MMIEILDFFYQAPIITLVFSIFCVILVLLQCITKRVFYKFRLIIALILAAGCMLGVVFFEEISKNELYKNILCFSLLGVDLIDFILIFSIANYDLANTRFQKVLTRAIDESKFYVLLDKKDRIKQISTLFIKDLGVDAGKIFGKNLFDVIENKYRIIGINGEATDKDMAKKYLRGRRNKEESTLEINIEEELENIINNNAIYFTDNPLYSSERYKGRILIGNKKTEDELVGLEKDLSNASIEASVLNDRFIAVISNTNDGIFFNNLTERSIWFNDILRKKLNLLSNEVSGNEFYKNIHPDDLQLYEEKLKEITDDEYIVTYRYNIGFYYVYVEEKGRRITSGNNVELSGIMNVYDNFKYEKTDTTLDNVIGSEKLLLRKNELIKSNQTFLAVFFKILDIPMINDRYGRNYGNYLLSEYVRVFKDKFIIDNCLYRVSGLEFVALITNYNKMETLKAGLRDNEKVLSLKRLIANTTVTINVVMGLSYSNDTINAEETIENAKSACKIASNNNYASNYAYYKDIK